MEIRRIQVDEKFLKIEFNKDGYIIEEDGLGSYLPKIIIPELMPTLNDMYKDKEIKIISE